MSRCGKEMRKTKPIVGCQNVLKRNEYKGLHKILAILGRKNKAISKHAPFDFAQRLP